MGILQSIKYFLEKTGLRQEFSNIFEFFAGPPDRSVAFTIAIISLAAKMAKADGQVTRDEVQTFRRFYSFAPGDEKHAARVYDLARQDVAGYDVYAQKIARLFKNDKNMLEHVLEALFHIAVADGEFHENEDVFIKNVAVIFGFSPEEYRQMRSRVAGDISNDAYDILGVAADTPLDVIRKQWKKLVKENHPDILTSRGLPQEAITLATQRLDMINAAWESIKAERTPHAYSNL